MLASNPAIEHAATAKLAGYVPLALRPDWVLERFYGWSLLWQDDDSKFVRRWRGPIVRHLVLINGLSADCLDRLARRCRVFHPLGILSLNDFAAAEEEPARHVAGRLLRPALGSRWFGVGTFVHDLAEDESTLWRRIASRERTKCTSALRAGLRIEIRERPTDNELRDLLGLYDRMAAERNLESAPFEALRAMSRSGSLELARCISTDGHTLVANVIHRAHDQGYFLLGARSADAPPGAGHLVHWEVLRKLKADGLRFYDLGLVASLDERDGIYRFKRSLGGTFISAGAELEWVSPLLAPVRKLLSRRHRTPHASR
jgi:hypothetical protein